MGPRTCIFETLLPAPLSGPLLPRHGWAVFPPWAITALLETHTQEIKYSSRTYWLLQRLLGKANETDSRKEMSVRHGVGGGGSNGEDKGGEVPPSFGLSWSQLLEAGCTFYSWSPQPIPVSLSLSTLTSPPAQSLHHFSWKTGVQFYFATHPGKDTKHRSI